MPSPAAPRTPGYRFKDGRLMIFQEDEVMLIRGWEDPLAVCKSDDRDLRIGALQHQNKLDTLDFPDHQSGMESTWPLQDAKNRLSELLETVMKNGAQTITRHGKPVAVVVSAETYARLQPKEKQI